MIPASATTEIRLGSRLKIRSAAKSAAGMSCSNQFRTEGVYRQTYYRNPDSSEGRHFVKTYWTFMGNVPLTLEGLIQSDADNRFLI
jgi:hypothetical protein